MNTRTYWTLGSILLIIIIIAGAFLLTSGAKPSVSTTTATTTPADTYGMTQYTDSAYGFSFWYPSALGVTASTTQGDPDYYPGGTVVQTLQVGTEGGAEIDLVHSPQSMITDEPNGHASPINQTKYFYDSGAGQWMVAYPEGSSMSGATGATTTADISKTTVGGLPMLASGARFDTSIVPLSTTEFLVVHDGGGSTFTPQLAQTIAATGVMVDASTLAAALRAEAAAYAND